MKGEPLNRSDLEELKKRILYCKRWLEKVAPESVKFELLQDVPEDVKCTLSHTQKLFLRELGELLLRERLDGKQIHERIYTLSQKMSLKATDAFKAIYLLLLGKERGPRAGNLLSALDKNLISQKAKYL
jgi:lysyl-tRNA synthetase class 1